MRLDILFLFGVFGCSVRAVNQEEFRHWLSGCVEGRDNQMAVAAEAGDMVEPLPKVALHMLTRTVGMLTACYDELMKAGAAIDVEEAVSD